MNRNFANINLASTDFTATTLNNANLTNANLVSAIFNSTSLANATLTNADARGASSMNYGTTEFRQNFIQPDGIMQGFALNSGETMLIWDYQGTTPLGIRVQNDFSMQPGSELAMLFQDGIWGSKIDLAGGSVSLAGILNLQLADGVTPLDLGGIGTTFQLFDWRLASSVSGQFSQIIQTGNYSGYAWDTSNLYTLGTIELVPEPSTYAQALFAAVLLALGVFLGRRKKA